MAPDTDKLAQPDPDQEPMFLLRGSDPVAHVALFVWACKHDRLGPTLSAESTQALDIAMAMKKWTHSQGQDVDRILTVWAQMISDAAARLEGAAVLDLPPGQRLQ